MAAKCSECGMISENYSVKMYYEKDKKVDCLIICECCDYEHSKAV